MASVSLSRLAPGSGGGGGGDGGAGSIGEAKDFWTMVTELSSYFEGMLWASSTAESSWSSYKVVHHVKSIARMRVTS